MTLLVRARAKLNLHLAVLARETSGYHSLETVFHRIELADDVIVKLAPVGIRIVRCSVDVGLQEQNLAYRAAVALLAEARWETGFDIQIVKRIPAGGGLGGGSADAAATLQALNALNPHPLAASRLLAVAASLGADVPFLTSDALMALAWGRGERILSLDPLPHRHVALVIPPFHVATADAYRWLDDGNGMATAPTVQELRYWHLANWEGVAHYARNDFEPVIASRFPLVSTVLELLHDSGATMAAMTGSGSTLFGVYETPPDQESLARATQCAVVVTETAGSQATPTRVAIDALI